MTALFLDLLLSATLVAQEPLSQAAPPSRDGPSPNVSFERLRQSNNEPHNWLTYSGSLASQRHSRLMQIQPGNARDLERKWVFQSRSLERHQVTPRVVDGTMYTIQSPSGVVALNAATGTPIWAYAHNVDPAAKNWRSMHRSVLRAGAGEHVHDVREGRCAAGVSRGTGLHRRLPRPGSTTDDVHSSVQAIDPSLREK
jgi:glucose dehydrogenase